MSSNYNMYTPAVTHQLRFISQWFKEWSEMQKGDFLPILVQSFGNNETINGLVAGIDTTCNMTDRPLSIFQCRIKLFKEWAEGWGEEEKTQLISQLRAIDEDFINKYVEEVDKIAPLKSDVIVNGNVDVEEVH